MIVYFIYCIIVAPIAFLISVILNHYYILNLLTIFISTFIMATPFHLFINFLHATSIPDQWGKIYSHFSTILLTIRLLS